MACWTLATVTSDIACGGRGRWLGENADGNEDMTALPPLSDGEDSPGPDAAPDDYSSEDDEPDDLSRHFSSRAKVLAQHAIRLELPVGKLLPDSDRHRVRIGWIQIEDDQRIAMRPCEGITPNDFDILATAALRARRDGPVPAASWRQLSGGLTTTVYAPRAEQDQSSA